MTRTLLTVTAYLLISFAVQGTSHFVLNADHYATIPFTRDPAIVPMGLVVMIIQGAIIGVVMLRLWPDGATLRQSLTVAACFGLFLASYIALAEPAKYAAPSIIDWVRTESLASFTQFLVFGLALAVIHRPRVATNA